MKHIKTPICLLLLIILVACNSQAPPNNKSTDDTGVQQTTIQPTDKSTFSMPKTKKMMPVNTYWNLIEKAKKASSDIALQADFLQEQLQTMSPEDIIGFRLRTDQLMAATYTSDMWCAAYIVNQGASDDGFEYFRLWLIAQGRAVFESVKNHPDNLISYVQSGETYEYESFWYIALDAFAAKTGSVLYDFIDDSFATEEGYYKPITFTWKEEEPETMQKICPKLFNKFMKA